MGKLDGAHLQFVNNRLTGRVDFEAARGQILRSLAAWRCKRYAAYPPREEHAVQLLVQKRAAEEETREQKRMRTASPEQDRRREFASASGIQPRGEDFAGDSLIIATDAAANAGAYGDVDVDAEVAGPGRCLHRCVDVRSSTHGMRPAVARTPLVPRAD